MFHLPLRRKWKRAFLSTLLTVLPIVKIKGKRNFGFKIYFLVSKEVKNKLLKALAENVSPATTPEVEAGISFNVANSAANSENKG